MQICSSAHVYRGSDHLQSLSNSSDMVECTAFMSREASAMRPRPCLMSRQAAPAQLLVRGRRRQQACRPAA